MAFQKFLRTIAFVCLVLSFSVSLYAVDWPEAGQGLLFLRYEPKVCFVEPCPLWKVLKFEVGEKEHKKVYAVESLQIDAYIENIDIRDKPITSFNHIYVKGSWQNKGAGLEITAEEWYSVIREKIPAKKGKVDSSSSTPSGSTPFIKSGNMR